MPGSYWRVYFFLRANIDKLLRISSHAARWAVKLVQQRGQLRAQQTAGTTGLIVRPQSGNDGATPTAITVGQMEQPAKRRRTPWLIELKPR